MVLLLFHGNIEDVCFSRYLLFFLCSPGNATLVSRGSLADGKGTLQSTYRFGAVDTANYSYTATATVVETGGAPVFNDT